MNSSRSRGIFSLLSVISLIGAACALAAVSFGVAPDLPRVFEIAFDVPTSAAVATLIVAVGLLAVQVLPRSSLPLQTLTQRILAVFGVNYFSGGLATRSLT